MKVTILGCGSSSGVPIIGCECAVCKSDNIRNKRLRVSILIEENGKNILVDSSPDLRSQALASNITKVDAVLFTHAHADHIAGLDELKSFNHTANKPIPVYTNKVTLDELKLRYEYAFKEAVPEFGWFRPCLVPNEIKDRDDFEVCGVKFQSFPQTHGRIISLGFRTGDFAYSTDVNALSEDVFALLEGVKVWVVDCIRHNKAPTHSHLDQTLEWVGKVRPELAVLTHMSHDFDYDDLKSKLPKGIIPGHDRMVLEI